MVVRAAPKDYEYIIVNTKDVQVRTILIEASDEQGDAKRAALDPQNTSSRFNDKKHTIQLEHTMDAK